MTSLYDEFITTRDTLLEGALAVDEEMEQLQAQCAALQVHHGLSEDHTAPRPVRGSHSTGAEGHTAHHR